MTVTGVIVPLSRAAGAGARLESGTKACAGDAAVWKAFGAVAVVAGVVGAICLRVAFYNMGLSVFMFY